MQKKEKPKKKKKLFALKSKEIRSIPSVLYGDTKQLLVFC